MNFLLRIFEVVALAATLVGCGTLSGYTKTVESNNEEGVVYGVGAVEQSNTAKDACAQLGNKDERCKNPDDYYLVVVTTKFGFSSARWGTMALVNKNYTKIKELYFNGAVSDKDAPFVKAKVNAGRFADVLDVVSTGGDGKCKWSGFNKAGGVVCKDYNYDYSKDFKGVNF